MLYKFQTVTYALKKVTVITTTACMFASRVKASVLTYLATTVTYSSKRFKIKGKCYTNFKTVTYTLNN